MMIEESGDKAIDLKATAKFEMKNEDELKESVFTFKERNSPLRNTKPEVFEYKK